VRDRRADELFAAPRSIDVSMNDLGLEHIVEQA
jgi:hypothetical protein